MNDTEHEKLKNLLSLEVGIAEKHFNLNILPKFWAANKHMKWGNTSSFGFITPTGWLAKTTYYEKDLKYLQNFTRGWGIFPPYSKDCIIGDCSIINALDFLTKMHNVEYNWVWPRIKIYNGKMYYPEDWTPENLVEADVPITMPEIKINEQE